jgi:hypothetical protein
MKVETGSLVTVTIVLAGTSRETGARFRDFLRETKSEMGHFMAGKKVRLHRERDETRKAKK